MLDLAGGTTVYLACGVTDLRKSYNGLAAIIKLKFHLDPYSRCMFDFCNRRRTSIKILQWDGSGFWILMKKLDGNSFHWPDTPDDYLLTYILVSFLVFLPFLIPFSM